MSKKILVLGEVRDGALRNVSFEAIAAAKQIADGGEVVGALLGHQVTDLANELIAYGADRVIVVEHPHLKTYTSDGFSQGLLAIIEQEKPEGIVIGHTALGKDLAPKVASAFNQH